MLSGYSKSRKDWFPEWLQVLVPESEEDEEGCEEGWEGRVGALKGAMEKVRDTMKRETSRDNRGREKGK